MGNTSEELLKQVEEFRTLGELDKAIDCLNKISKDDAHYIFAQDLKVEILEEKKKHLKGLSSCNISNVDDNSWAPQVCIFIGSSYMQRKKYSEAITYFDRIPEGNKYYFTAQLWKGHVFREQGKYHQAICYYDKIPENNQEYSNAQVWKGAIWGQQREYTEAINCYDKICEGDTNYYQAQLRKGDVLRVQGKYHESFESFDKIPESDKYYYTAQFYKGLALREQGKYNDAIFFYDKIPENNQEYSNAQMWKGVILEQQGEYSGAINCYDKICEGDANYYNALFGKGKVLRKQGKYDEAIQCYKIIPKNDGVYSSSQLFQAYCLVKLKYERKEAKIRECISNTNNIDVFIILSEKDLLIPEKRLLIRIALDYKFTNKEKDFFCDALRNWDIEYSRVEYHYLREIYLTSLEVICLLHVDHEEEKFVAHYATLETARNLILRNDKGKTSPIRMASAATTNDPTEGRVLLQSLGVVLDMQGADYVAFMGCFTFNVNSLNQFRLYGKDNKNEATGLSIGVNMSLFSHKLTSSTKMEHKNEKQITSITSIEEEPFHALYRCMYLDPSSDQIVSVGQRDNYSILLDRKLDAGDYRKRKEDYEKYIQTIMENLQDAMDQLKGEIKKLTSPTFDPLVAELLIGVRYLTKHAAFKEENECRIFSVKNVESKEIKFNQERTRMYIEYKPILGHIEQIYFAPNAEHFEVMRVAFKQEKSDIVCIQSTHPFA